MLELCLGVRGGVLIFVEWVGLMVAVGDLLLFALGWYVGVFGCGFPVCEVCYSSRLDFGLFAIDFV